MHTRFHYFHRFLSAIAFGLVVLVVACTNNTESPSPTTTGPFATVQATQEPRTVDAAARTSWPNGQPVEQSQWVQDRLNVMKRIYRFTPEGEAWIDGYDLRQMVEQPAWFGSFGYNLWAGAGEAVPRSVLHEISHSYWGAFTVEGRPELSWDTSDGTAEALAAFREDLDTFLRQPPDRFEPLRDRFRNLPNLNRGDYPDLFHFGEADLLNMVGGNLQLIPPILRPYFSGYLAEGGAGAEGGEVPETWDVAIAWFNSLENQERRIAGEVFGLQHFPRGPYLNLPDASISGLDNEVRTLYENEERQRLIDFSEQFDGILEREFSLIDAAGADRGFDFWRGYLSDKLFLHQRYPEVLRDADSQRAVELAAALDFYSDVTGGSESEQVDRFREVSSQPQIAQLAVLLKPRAIIELFSESGSETGIAAVLGGRAERLAGLVEVVEEVDLINSSANPVSAALELERFMRSIPEDQLRADIFLMLELLRSPDGRLAREVLPALSDDALVFLLEVQPAAARSFEISPERLLDAVGITEISSLDAIRDGAELLAANSSGNFAIDAAYDSAVFSHLDRFVESQPSEVLAVVVESEMRLVPWIGRESDGALVAMRAVPAAAVRALSNLSGSRETPYRIIHLVAKEDPELAAQLTFEMELLKQGPEGDALVFSVAEKVIREFGYDLYWSERNSGPNVDPAKFAHYLLALNDLLEPGQLDFILRQVFLGLDSDRGSGLIEDEARAEFVRTFAAAIDTQRGDERKILDNLLSSTIGFG